MDKRRANRLFRVITLRYNSFKSDVANRPPSNWTIGLKPGGITGKTVKIIHSGFELVLKKLSKIRMRRVARFNSISESGHIIISRLVFICFDKLISFNKLKITSAP